jgi:hypothetical protein
VEELIWRCIKPFTKIIDSNVNYEQVLILIDNELRKVSDNTLQQLSFALDHLSNILAPLKYISKAAEQLIKTLANILNINSGSSKPILQAIRGLSKIAPIEYVKRVFDKNI